MNGLANFAMTEQGQNEIHKYFSVKVKLFGMFLRDFPHLQKEIWKNNIIAFTKKHLFLKLHFLSFKSFLGADTVSFSIFYIDNELKYAVVILILCWNVCSDEILTYLLIRISNYQRCIIVLKLCSIPFIFHSPSLIYFIKCNATQVCLKNSGVYCYLYKI